MYTYEVSGFPEYIDISLPCPKCGKQLEERVWIPTPNYLSERDSFSGTRNDDFFEISCSCGHVVSGQTTGSCSGNYIYLNDIDNDYPAMFDEQYEEYDWFDGIKNKDYYDTFVNSINNTKKLNDISLPFPTQEKTLTNLLYANLVTCLEAYLADALATNVLSNNKFREAFIRTYKPFTEEKIAISEIIDTYSNIDSRIKAHLSAILYHNIGKVSKIYKSVFGISFPKFDEIATIVHTRHDLIHRNGKDNDGNEIILTKTEFNDAFNKICSFVEAINNSLNECI